MQFATVFYQTKVHDKHHSPMTLLEVYMNLECRTNSYQTDVRTTAIVLRNSNPKIDGNPCCRGFVPCKTNVNWVCALQPTSCQLHGFAKVTKIYQQLSPLVKNRFLC